MTRRTAILMSCGALLGGGVLAGCGSDDEPGGGGGAPAPVGKAPVAPKVAKPADPTQAITEAAARTAKAPSYAITSKTEVEAGGTTFAGTFAGVADLKTRKSSAQLDFTGLASALPGDKLDALGGKGALKGQLISDGSGGGLKIYVKLGALNKGFSQAGSPALAPWGTVDVSDLPSIGGFDFASLLSVSQSADQSTALLRALAGDPTEVGTESVDGQPATHYRATVDYAKPAAGAPPAVRKLLSQTAELLETAGAPTSMPLDVWIGEDGYVRKESFVQSVPGQPTKTTTTVTLADFGAPVSVQIPPADQTWDVLAEVKERFPGTLESLEAAGTAASDSVG